MRLIIIFSVIFFAIDQLSKWIMLGPLDLQLVREIAVFPPILVFKMAWNDGINFGLLGGYSEYSRWILVAIAVAISIWIALWARRYAGLFPALCAGMVVGGALGNAIDRVIYGAVVDFLNMSCCGIDNPYVFNLADVFVFAGIFGILIFSNRFKLKP
ncbi:MAG: signal peptidase II [Pseudomonadota bacterium]